VPLMGRVWILEPVRCRNSSGDEEATSNPSQSRYAANGAGETASRRSKTSQPTWRQSTERRWARFTCRCAGADVVLARRTRERKSGRERVDVMWGEWRVAGGVKEPALTRALSPRKGEAFGPGLRL